MDALAKNLNDSEKITILAGAGCAGAHAELITLAGKLNPPIVHALRGKEFIDHDNPFDVGMTGLLGFSSGYFAMMNCNTLLMIGTDFPYQQFFPESVPQSQGQELACGDNHRGIVAEGDYVILHGRFSRNGQPAALIAADIVRMEDGRLAEHWDVQDEATKAESKSGLPMFGGRFTA